MAGALSTSDSKCKQQRAVSSMGESLFCPRESQRVLVLGGEDFKTGVSIVQCRDPVKPAFPPCSEVPKGVRGHQLCGACLWVGGSQAVGCSHWHVLT